MGCQHKAGNNHVHDSDVEGWHHTDSTTVRVLCSVIYTSSRSPNSKEKVIVSVERSVHRSSISAYDLPAESEQEQPRGEREGGRGKEREGEGERGREREGERGKEREGEGGRGREREGG